MGIVDGVYVLFVSVGTDVFEGDFVGVQSKDCVDFADDVGIFHGFFIGGDPAI